MLSRIVIGTLSTLNTMMSPLAYPGAPHSPVQVFDLKGTCSARQSPQSDWVMTVEKAGRSYLAVRMAERPCAGTSRSTASAPNEVAFTIPAQLSDIELIERLPVGHGYVVPGVPSLENADRKSQVKLTKQAPEGNLIPIVVEWVPDSQGRVTHEPFKIWVNTAATEGRIPWKKVRVSQMEPDQARPVELRGEWVPPSEDEQ